MASDEQLLANIRAVVDQAERIRATENDEKQRTAEIQRRKDLEMLQFIVRRFVDEKTDTINATLSETALELLRCEFGFDAGDLGGNLYRLTLPHDER